MISSRKESRDWLGSGRQRGGGGARKTHEEDGEGARRQWRAIPCFSRQSQRENLALGPPALQLHYWSLFSSDITACWGLGFTTLAGATSPSSWPMLIEMHLGKRGWHHTRADLGPGAASGRSGTQGPPPSPVSCLVHGGHSAVERRWLEGMERKNSEERRTVASGTGHLTLGRGGLAPRPHQIHRPLPPWVSAFPHSRDNPEALEAPGSRLTSS